MLPSRFANLERICSVLKAVKLIDNIMERESSSGLMRAIWMAVERAVVSASKGHVAIFVFSHRY